MAKNKIKTRKQLEKEYSDDYSGVSHDMWQRICDYLGDKFNEDLIQDALDRVKEARKKIKYHAIKFTFYEVPMQSHRPRVNYFTKSMHVPNAKENSECVRKLIAGIRKDIELISTPMKVILKAYYPMPTDIKPIEVLLYETEHDFAIGKPDFDNVLKAYCDMIQGHIILDDDLVCSSQFDKYFSILPRVELTIIYQDGYASEYTYKKIKSRKSYKEQSDRITSELIVTPHKKKRRGKANEIR